MQPSKSMLDYMMELNRLFPKTPENDIHTPTPTFQSRFGPTPTYSSSSTDSFSPETFPELSYRPEYRTEYRSETPFATGRPIVGRKILGNPEQKPIELSFDERFESPRHYSIEHTPPKETLEQKNYMPKHWDHTPPRLEQRNYMKNYELFPGNMGNEFKTPVKTPSNISPVSSMSQNSPVSNFGMFPSPYLSLASSPIPMSPTNLRANTSRFPEIPQTMCSFCRKNGETPLVYMTHSLKEKRGHRNVVTCPILRSHVCSTCGVSGDNAHTMTYCPVLRSSNNGVPLKSTTVTLKNTRIKSNGRRRY